MNFQGALEGGAGPVFAPHTLPCVAGPLSAPLAPLSGAPQSLWHLQPLPPSSPPPHFQSTLCCGYPPSWRTTDAGESLMAPIGLHTMAGWTKSGFCSQRARGTDTGQGNSDVISATGSGREPEQVPIKTPNRGRGGTGGMPHPWRSWRCDEGTWVKCEISTPPEPEPEPRTVRGRLWVLTPSSPREQTAWGGVRCPPGTFGRTANPQKELPLWGSIAANAAAAVRPHLLPTCKQTSNLKRQNCRKSAVGFLTRSVGF